VIPDTAIADRAALGQAYRELVVVTERKTPAP
jgi:hypothetical protein